VKAPSWRYVISPARLWVALAVVKIMERKIKNSNDLQLLIDFKNMWFTFSLLF
jgi:hypothetical protein